MSVNSSRLLEQRKQLQAKTYTSFGKGNSAGFPFKSTRISALTPGVYTMRLLWTDPIKNPDGVHLISTHSVEEGTKVHRFLTAECLPPEKAYNGIDLVLDQIDKYKIYDKLKNSTDSNHLTKVIDKLNPWKRYWIPCFLWAKEIPGVKDGDWPTYIPEPDIFTRPLDKVLEVNFSVKMMDALFALFERYPDICHHANGRNITLTVKGNRYDISVANEPSALPPDLVSFASENYPNLPVLAQKFSYKSPTEIYSLLEAQSWFPRFVNPNDGSPGDKNADGSVKGMNLVFPRPEMASLPVAGVPSAGVPATATDSAVAAAPRKHIPAEPSVDVDY
jgi:hypothetical protein